MAWVQLEQSLPGHKKLLHAMGRLGVSRATMVGHLSLLWLWGLDNATPDGRLGKLVTARTIAIVAEWPGDPEEFTQALLDAGFLDRDADGGYVLHDYEDYAGKLLAKRERKRQQDRERQRRRRERLRAQQAAEQSDVTRDSSVTDERLDGESPYKSRVEKSRVEKSRVEYQGRNINSSSAPQNDETEPHDATDLQAPLPAPEGRALEQPTPSRTTRAKQKPEPDPRVKAVIDHYHRRFREIFGNPPVIQGGRDGTLIRKISREYSAEQICSVMDAWFERRHEGWVWRNGDIPSFVAVFNRIVSQANGAREIPLAYRSLMEWARERDEGEEGNPFDTG